MTYDFDGTETVRQDDLPTIPEGKLSRTSSPCDRTVTAKRDSASIKFNQLPYVARRHHQPASTAASSARESTDSAAIFRRFRHVTNSNGENHAQAPAGDVPGGAGRTPGRTSDNCQYSRLSASLSGRQAATGPAGRSPGACADAGQRPPLSLPTISDLLHLAVTVTDFVGDLDPATLEANCANSIDLAADIWSDAHGTVTVPLSLIQWARCALLLEAEAMLRDREVQAEAERLDAITAGDINHAGNFIPHNTYRSA